jgi:hypothetical protein
MQTLDLRDLAKLEAIARDVHQNAVDKGWWPLTQDGKANWIGRNVGEILILATSELTEALEVWRDGKNLTETWKGDKGKPEGYPIEMADFVIRVIETMIACGSQFNSCFKIVVGSTALEEALKARRDAVKETPTPNVGEELMEISLLVAQAYDITKETIRDPRPNNIWTEENGIVRGFGVSLAHAVYDAFKQANRIGFDLWKAIEEKHAYNRTRPVRHGGKLA